MQKVKLSFLAMVVVTLLFLVSCSKDIEDKKNSPPILSLEVTNGGHPIKGGTLNVALVKDEPFQGIFLSELSEDNYDSTIMSYASNSIFETDGDFLITDKGIASLKVDQANRKAVVKLRKGVKWSDGEPLKIEDLIFPYLIIGHKDYTGVRYDKDLQNIIGMQEYHAGTASSIAGLKKVDDSTLEIRFKKLSPAIFAGGDGLWSYAAPSHQLKNLAVADLIESDAVRKNPVTLGAFKFEKIVPGESVLFTKNEYYWKGAPKLDGVLVKVVPSSSISVAIQSGEYDIVSNFDATKWEEIKDLNNIAILGRPELFYSYIGFKLGKFDSKKGEVVVNPYAKMANQSLRQAMGYALDVEQVSEVYYNNLRMRANSFIPPAFTTYYDDTLKGYTYNPKKAKSLLDYAGYKDIDQDGFRESPNGEKLVIHLAAMASDATQEDIALYYLQNWKDIGLNVKLTTGRLMEFNSFYEQVKSDNPEIDVFMAAWGTGANPSPGGLYSKKAAFNFSRYTSDEMETMLVNIDSSSAFDAKYRAAAFRKWQRYMLNVAAVIPLQFRYEIVPVNKRVKRFSIDFVNGIELNEIELVKEKGAQATK